jgi:AraC-like DNA-binding protein
MVDFGPATASVSVQSRPAPTVAGPTGVQTLTLTELAERAPAALLRQPHRLDHHLLMLVTVGHGSQTVDFVRYRCRPGTLVWARPGQVIRYGAEPGFDAALVRWAPGFLPPLHTAAALVEDPFGPVWCQLAGEDEDAVINEVTQLGVDCERHPDDGLGEELLRHQLAVLILRVVMLLPQEANPAAANSLDGAAEAAAFLRFRREVEHSFADTRRVEEYAARLGCSVRTLTRASLAATGRSAKQLIDDRVALEAKRLLAYTDEPVAEIGHRLGFPEPTNFGRFFGREVGMSPGAFRTDARE